MILSRVWATNDGVQIGNYIYRPPASRNSINYYTVIDFHNLQSLHTNLLSLFPLVTTIRFLAMDL
jgi:hypothetical protein